jgi:hypothetical protein
MEWNGNSNIDFYVHAAASNLGYAGGQIKVSWGGYMRYRTITQRLGG